jgi:hypothetical protein
MLAAFAQNLRRLAKLTKGLMRKIAANNRLAHDCPHLATSRQLEAIGIELLERPQN